MGVDPVWGLSTQKLTFSNNIKMKLSVIMGIVHMTIGVIIKGANTIFRKDYPSLIFEVVTGLVMLLGLFGWMDLLIYGKWFFPINFTDRTVIEEKGLKEYQGDLVNRRTPSVINIMITTIFGGAKPVGNNYSFLVSGDRTTYPPNEDMQAAMYNISFFLMICAMICIPLMLLVKPLCCRKGSKKVNDNDFSQIEMAEGIQPAINYDATDELVIDRHRQTESINQVLKDLAGPGGHDDFGEIFVH